MVNGECLKCVYYLFFWLINLRYIFRKKNDMNTMRKLVYGIILLAVLVIIVLGLFQLFGDHQAVK